MKKVLVIGATGQIGSELVVKLRSIYGDNQVVAGYVPGVIVPDAIRNGGPLEVADILNPKQLAEVVDKYEVDGVYNLAALLSVVGEQKPILAWNIQINGVLNLLEIAREKKLSVFTPSSIGAFGDTSPKDHTPQDTIQRPTTIYGISKVTCELLSDYYFHRYGVDTRSVRFPGLISYTTPPGGGTTDYAIDMYHAAVKGEKYACPLQAGTFLDLMYMPDALHGAIQLMEADPSRLKHRNAFNIASISVDPEMIFDSIRKVIPNFEMVYKIDTLRQEIANSWPNSLDDSCAREEWDWNPICDLECMTLEMTQKLKLLL